MPTFPWWLLLACGGDDSDSGASIVVPPPTTVPVLAISAPSRGAFLPDAAALRAEGTLTRGTGDLTSLRVNGSDVPVDAAGGPFAGEVPVAPGLVILGARAEAADGERAVDGRAVISGPVHAPGAPLSGSVKLQIGPGGLDDDDPSDLDDLAALATLVLEDSALAGSFVGLALPNEYAVVTVTSADWGAVDVDLDAEDGSIAVALALSDVALAFDVEGVDWYEWVSTTGTLQVERATVTLDLALSADGGVVSATPRGTAVSLDGFAVTLDWFPDSLEDDLSDYLRADVEAALADAVEEQVAGLIADTLTGLATDVAFDGVDISAALSSVRCATDGIRLVLDVSASAASAFSLPAGAGSVRTDGDGPAFPLTDADGPAFAAAADDDLLNQLLFAVWSSGALQGFTFGAVEMTALAGEIPAPLGPVAQVDARVDLPPVFGPPTHADAAFDVSLGELRMVVAREDGVITDASINVRTGASIAFTDAGAADLSLDARPAYMTLEIGVESWPEGLDPGDMAALLRLSTPPLLGSIARFLPAFELPSFPLDGTVDALSGRELRLVSPEATSRDGWLVLTSELSAD
jgi:hypothetical protein